MGDTLSPRVVVLDSDPDTIEMLKTWLEFHGFLTAVGNLSDFRVGKEDLLAFLHRATPDVIVYDLGVPYESNYQFLQRVRDEPAFQRAALVITTTNARAVQSLLGIQALEILGKPYDLEVLLQAVRTAGADAAVSRDAHSVERREERRKGERRKGDRRIAGSPGTPRADSALH